MASSQPPIPAALSAETRGAPPERPPRLPDVVAERLQNDLLAQGLRPGDRLPTEPQLVERYGVSRTVIREAGRILEQRGLVDIRPGRGMTVSKPDGSAIVRHYSLMLGMNATTFQQLMETRLIIEVEVTALAAARRTEEDLHELRASLGRVERHMSDYQVCLEEDVRFHEIVTRAGGNPFFSWFMDPVNTCLRESYKDAGSYLGSLPQTLAEHGAILEAIAAGDSDAAREAARAHLNRVVSQQDELVPGREPR